METRTTAHFSLSRLCPIHALSPSASGDSADDSGSQGSGWRHTKGGFSSCLIIIGPKQQSTCYWLLPSIDYFHILLCKPEYVWEVWQRNNRFSIQHIESALKDQWDFFCVLLHSEAHLLTGLKKLLNHATLGQERDFLTMAVLQCPLVCILLHLFCINVCFPDQYSSAIFSVCSQAKLSMTIRWYALIHMPHDIMCCYAVRAKCRKRGSVDILQEISWKHGSFFCWLYR